MSAKDNTSLVRKVYEAFNNNQIDKIAQWVSPNAVLELVPTGERYNGPDGFVRGYKDWRAGYPDINVEITNQIATDTHVVTESKSTGTNTGPMQGPNGTQPPTGKKVTTTMAEVWEIRDGKIQHARVYFDTGSVMQQLGIVPKAA